MHELSLAESILPVVLATAEAHGAERVLSVTVVAGELQQIVPSSLQTCFVAVAAGTLAEGAELLVEVEPTVARCRRCEQEFRVEEFNFICPTCGLADVETIAGDGLVLRELELSGCESKSSTTS